MGCDGGADGNEMIGTLDDPELGEESVGCSIPGLASVKSALHFSDRKPQ